MPQRLRLILLIILGCATILLIIFVSLAISPKLFKWSVRSEISTITPPQRLLVVFAHTDDEVTNSALIHHFANQGTDITLLTLTDGAANPQSDLSACQNGETITKCRIRELHNSAKHMGVRRVAAPLLPDSKLMEHLPQAIQAVNNELLKLQPDAVMTMEPSGLNGLADHRAAFSSVAGALKQSTQKPILFLSTLPWPISFFLPTEIPHSMHHKRMFFQTNPNLQHIKVTVAETHKSQASTIKGLTLGLGPELLFKWIDFETYSVHHSDDLSLLQK